MKIRRSKSLIRWKKLASYIIHLFKVVFESSYDCILIFGKSPYGILCSYVEIDSSGTLFVALKNIYERDFFNNRLKS